MPANEEREREPSVRVSLVRLEGLTRPASRLPDDQRLPPRPAFLQMLSSRRAISPRSVPRRGRPPPGLPPRPFSPLLATTQNSDSPIRTLLSPRALSLQEKAADVGSVPFVARVRSCHRLEHLLTCRRGTQRVESEGGGRGRSVGDLALQVLGVIFCRR